MVVRDPNFWRRFSIAVHQDDAAREQMTARPNLKHSYVSSSSSASPSASAIAFCTTTITTTVAPSAPVSASARSASSSEPGSARLGSPPMRMSSLGAALSPLAAPPMHFNFAESAVDSDGEENGTRMKPKRPVPAPKRRRSKLQKTPSTRPLLRPAPVAIPPTRSNTSSPVLPSLPPQSPFTPPKSLFTSPSRPTKHTPMTPPRPRSRGPSLPFPSLSHASYRNSSTFSLSGRHPSHFKFWTTITADPRCRESWLERTQKKRKQRAWMCWVFWGVFVLLAAGVVVTVLVLKGKKII